MNVRKDARLTTHSRAAAALELLGGSPRSVGELGAKLGMDTGTITPLLKRLEQPGLITSPPYSG
jgi:DNA-binding MarR family transcriptional regulator